MERETVAAGLRALWEPRCAVHPSGMLVACRSYASPNARTRGKLRYWVHVMDDAWRAWLSEEPAATLATAASALDFADTAWRVRSSAVGQNALHMARVLRALVLVLRRGDDAAIAEAGKWGYDHIKRIGLLPQAGPRVLSGVLQREGADAKRLMLEAMTRAMALEERPTADGSLLYPASPGRHAARIFLAMVHSCGEMPEDLAEKGPIELEHLVFERFEARRGRYSKDLEERAEEAIRDGFRALGANEDAVRTMFDFRSKAVKR